MDRLRVCFSALRADALLVSHLPNIQYLCGFTGSAALLLIEPHRSTLFTDSRYAFQADEEVAEAGVQIAKKGLVRVAGRALRRRRGRTRVAYAASQVSVSQKEALAREAGSRVRWMDGRGLVEKLRAVKDPQELATMREAAQLITAVFQELGPKIKSGASEIELAAEIDYAIKLKGAAGPSFETIVASGERSAWAHARPSPKLLGKNELVVLDQGAILRGYCSDMTRTVFMGRAPENVRKTYKAVLEAQAAAKAAIRPGVTAGAVDRAARRLLRGYGLDRQFTHSTGHGLGLEVHEMPRLGQREKTVLQEGMVLTVEPGVYIEGIGGIRIEDDVLVTASGAEDLTTAPRELLEL
jgi:Xaa-Pro aminopeptidase